MEKDKKYWTNFIIQTSKLSGPWRCSTTESCKTFDEAMEVIEFQRNHYNVLSAWIDEQKTDGSIKVVFHECYLDACGNIIKKEKKQLINLL